MNNYVIEDNTVRLTVNGKEISFRADSEFSSRLASLANEAAEKKENCENDDEIEVSAFLSYVLDTLIGDGTVEKLFGDILPDPLDLCDVISFVADAFGDYRRRRIAAIKGVA